jgi:RNA 3'-terminal phosphate cyclase (ATP)
MGIKQKLRTFGTKASFEKSSPGDICRDGQGSRIDSDKVGRLGRSSESTGRYVAEKIIEDVKTGAIVDGYIAEQLIIYAGLAEGVIRYSASRITEHVETNLWLIEEFLGARTKIDSNVLEIEGISFA